MARVLLVDDEQDIRDLVRISLGRAGHDVLLAGDGHEGLAVALRERPDVIVLDAVMPGLQGWDVLTHLKACPAQAVAEIPVIVLSATDSALDRIRAGIEGAVLYLPKPFSIAELRRAVEDALAGEPEPAKRRRVQEQAMHRLAALEAAADAGYPVAAGPAVSQPPPPPEIRGPKVASLSCRQREVLAAVASAMTVTDAAERLGMSRTSVYANLHRAARRLGLSSAQELLRLARAGLIEFDEPR